MLEAWTPRESTRFLMLEQMVEASGPGSRLFRVPSTARACWSVGQLLWHNRLPQTDAPIMNLAK